MRLWQLRTWGASSLPLFEVNWSLKDNRAVAATEQKSGLILLIISESLHQEERHSDGVVST